MKDLISCRSSESHHLHVDTSYDIFDR